MSDELSTHGSSVGPEKGGHGDGHGHDHDHGHGHDDHIHPAPRFFLTKYVFSTDHKVIGIQFLFSGLIFFVLGGLLAMAVRWQLAWPWKPMPILSQLALVRARRSATRCRRKTTTSCSPCTRRS